MSKKKSSPQEGTHKKQTRTQRKSHVERSEATQGWEPSLDLGSSSGNDYDRTTTADSTSTPDTSTLRDQDLLGFVAVAGFILSVVVNLVGAYLTIQYRDYGRATLAMGLILLLLVWMYLLYRLRKHNKRQLVPLGGKRHTLIQTHLPRIHIGFVWGIPIAVVVATAAYYLFAFVPPQVALILVADIQDPSRIDSTYSTRVLYDAILSEIKDIPQVRARRIFRSIDTESGEGEHTALEIGNLPHNRAAFVLWGDQVRIGDEVKYKLHFEVLRHTQTEFGGGILISTKTALSDIEVHSAQLGTDAANLAATIVALSLAATGEHEKSIELFKTVTDADSLTFGTALSCAARLSIGDGYLELERQKAGFFGNQYFADADRELTSLYEGFVGAGKCREIAGYILMSMGSVFLRKGDLSKARELFESGEREFVLYEDYVSRANAFARIGDTFVHEGNYSHALTHYNAAIEEASKLVSQEEISGLLISRGSAFDGLMKRELAQQDYTNAIAYLERSGDRGRVLEALIAITGNAWFRFDIVRACEYSRRVSTMSIRIGFAISPPLEDALQINRCLRMNLN